MGVILGTSNFFVQDIFSHTYCAKRENIGMLIYDPKKIIALRKDRGLNQSALAKKVGISAPSMWALERGETAMPKASTLLGVARALGVPLSSIMATSQAADIDGQIAAAVCALQNHHKAAILAAALSLAESQKKPPKNRS